MVIVTKINKPLQQFSEWCDLSGGIEAEDRRSKQNFMRKKNDICNAVKLFRFLNFQSHEFIELVKESLCVNSMAEYY